jgi:TolA-binding protein
MRKIAVVLLMFSLQAPAQTAPKAHSSAAVASQSQSQNPKELAQLRGRIAALEQQLSDLNAKFKKLDATVSVQGATLTLKQNKHSEIHIDPSDHNYQRLDFDSGLFLVSLKDIQPYLNGYKVALEIGNPSGATYRGAKFKCTWSKPYNWEQFSDASYQAWLASVHSTVIDVTTVLEPVTWNQVELTLIPATVEELSNLSLSIDTNTLSLRRK